MGGRERNGWKEMGTREERWLCFPSSLWYFSDCNFPPELFPLQVLRTGVLGLAQHPQGTAAAPSWCPAGTWPRGTEGWPCPVLIYILFLLLQEQGNARCSAEGGAVHMACVGLAVSQSPWHRHRPVWGLVELKARLRS